jgi:hypothetical protein
MTRARFKTELKLFALNERAEGKRWPIIQQHIQEKFKVPPPTVRAMEKWGKSLNRETIADEMLKDVKAQFPKIEAEAQMEVGRNLLPVILKARESGQDMEAVAMMWFFEWLEAWFGSERFYRLIDQYISKRNNGSIDKTEETKS